jgi:hypothetical protein
MVRLCVTTVAGIDTTGLLMVEVTPYVQVLPQIHTKTVRQAVGQRTVFGKIVPQTQLQVHVTHRNYVFPNSNTF